MNNAFNQFSEGYNQGQDMAQGLARQRAGNSLANGDYGGATNALYRSGQLEAGSSVQNFGNAQHKQEVADRLEFFGKAAAALAQIPDDGTQTARKAALAHLTPTFQAMGMKPQDIQQLQAADLSNASLSAFGANLAKQLELIKGQDGELGTWNAATGTYSQIRAGSPKPSGPHWVERKKADGSTEWIDLTAASAAAPATPAAGPGGPGGPGGPLNGQDFYKKFILPHEGGYNPSDMNGSPVNMGFNQAANRDINVRNLTPDTAAQRFATNYYGPSGAANLPPALAAVHADTYFINPSKAQQLLQQSGGDPNKYLDLRAQWLDRLAQTPSGAKYGKAWTNRTNDLRTYIGQMGGAAPAASGTMTAIPGSEPKPGENTAVDPNIVKGLIEGRITPPTQKAAATPYWQAQLQAATAQDPTFDGINFQARAKTRADFTSGKSAQNITALNTVIGHLDHLDRTINDLGNTGPGGALNFGPLNALNNKAAQVVAGASGTDARYKNFETAKTAVANELTRVFRGTGGAEADIQGWMKQLDGAGSPEALHKVVQSMAELIKSRIEALGEQYQQGMGTTKDPITLLTPDKQRAFQRLMGGQAAAAPPSQQQAAPAGWSVKRVR